MKTPHLDPDWLRQKYVVEGLSTYAIAKLVNRDPKRIHEKLRDFDIPTRPRGHNLHGKDNSWAQEGYVPHWLGRNHTPESRAKIAESAKGPKPGLRGCVNGMYGVTGNANPNWRGGISPERQRIYASSAWKAVARQVRERDRDTCRRCDLVLSGWRKLHLHHIAGWDDAPDLRLEPENIVVLCDDCHRWVHSPRNAEREWLAPHVIPALASSEST